MAPVEIYICVERNANRSILITGLKLKSKWIKEQNVIPGRYTESEKKRKWGITFRILA